MAKQKFFLRVIPGFEAILNFLNIHTIEQKHLLYYIQVVKECKKNQTFFIFPISICKLQQINVFCQMPPQMNLQMYDFSFSTFRVKTLKYIDVVW